MHLSSIALNAHNGILHRKQLKKDLQQWATMPKKDFLYCMYFADQSTRGNKMQKRVSVKSGIQNQTIPSGFGDGIWQNKNIEIKTSFQDSGQFSIKQARPKDHIHGYLLIFVECFEPSIKNQEYTFKTHFFLVPVQDMKNLGLIKGFTHGPDSPNLKSGYFAIGSREWKIIQKYKTNLFTI